MTRFQNVYWLEVGNVKVCTAVGGSPEAGATMTDIADAPVTTEANVKLKMKATPYEPTDKEREEHDALHIPFRSCHLRLFRWAERWVLHPILGIGN